jgi:GDP-L-fucose synthase
MICSSVIEQLTQGNILAMSKRVLITGGTGMIGNAFKHVNTSHELIFIGSKDCNLLNQELFLQTLKNYNPDAIIHLAARVGGVKANTDFIGDFFSDNLQINHNVLNAAKNYGVKKVVSLLSTCVYPDNARYPLTEEQINEGPPHHSNFGYAYAKRMLDVQSRAYRQQYGCNFITAIPNNLFGEHDYFDLQNSHVIPAIIRKMHEAKLNNDDVVLWGDGSPLREFTYSKDLANILLFLLENYDGKNPINIGNTHETSIKEVAESIAEVMKFNGNIKWDTDKPMGQFRKPSDNSKLLDLGWKSENYTEFKKALIDTCQWFNENYPNIRGVN